MSDLKKNQNNSDLFALKAKMEDGYQEMGPLNISLSEEGLSQDIESLKSYEKYLVESE